MELKLLQEKDIEKHGQIDQLEKVNLNLCSFLAMEYLSTKIFWPLKTALITINQAIKRRSKNSHVKN
jgi:hypothetical protein